MALKSLSLSFIFLSFFLFSAPQMAVGSTFIYDMGSAFSGTPPTGSQPWVSATFTDLGPNSVQLVLSTSGLTTGESVKDWYFNLDPDQNASHLHFSVVEATGGLISSPSLITSGKIFAGGGGAYDLDFTFAPGNSGNPFNGLKTITLNLWSSDNHLSADDFNFLADPHGGDGVYYTAAHIQNTGSNGKDSAFIGTNHQVEVPEPFAYLLFGSLLACAFAFSKWRNHSRNLRSPA